MKRIFSFVIPSLNYSKNDLNIPSSPNRLIIGTLSRMVTNAIFLSHALRDNLIIRILVLEPVPHLYHISNEKIRYLGPGLRSLASILLKAEKYLLENDKLAHNWLEPNPGLFVIKNYDIYFDLAKDIEEPMICINIENKTYEKQQTQKEKDYLILKNYSLSDIEYYLKTIKGKWNTILIILSMLDSPLNYVDYFKEDSENNIVIQLKDEISNPKIVSIMNLILDDIE
ncbi:MAG: hypothetical protein FK734_17300 [Asgard group archaeon]|nr:hypothetical protein [Asgard group archaeon]